MRENLLHVNLLIFHPWGSSFHEDNVSQKDLHENKMRREFTTPVCKVSWLALEQLQMHVDSLHSCVMDHTTKKKQFTLSEKQKYSPRYTLRRVLSYEKRFHPTQIQDALWLGDLHEKQRIKITHRQRKKTHSRQKRFGRQC